MIPSQVKITFFLTIDHRFRIAPLSWRVSVDRVSLTIETRAAFSIFFKRSVKGDTDKLSLRFWKLNIQQCKGSLYNSLAPTQLQRSANTVTTMSHWGGCEAYIKSTLPFTDSQEHCDKKSQMRVTNETSLRTLLIPLEASHSRRQNLWIRSWRKYFLPGEKVG